MGYTEDRAALVALLGLTDNTTLSLRELQQLQDTKNIKGISRTIPNSVAAGAFAASLEQGLTQVVLMVILLGSLLFRVELVLLQSHGRLLVSSQLPPLRL